MSTLYIFVVTITLITLIVFAIVEAMSRNPDNKKKPADMRERRKWGRIPVPDKKLSCRITEPDDIASEAEFLINNINAMGISFNSNKEFLKDTVLRLRVKFPFTTYEDTGNVWGRIAYSRKIPNKNAYSIGFEYIRKKTGD